MKDLPLFPIVFLVAIFISSCATLAKTPMPVPESQEQRYFDLKQDAVAYELVTAKDEPAYFVFKACRYKLAFIDKSGGYYVGPDGCLQAKNFLSEGSSNYLGGIWISSEPGIPPRMYGVVGMGPDACNKLGPVLCLLSKHEAGKFKMIPGQMNSTAAQAIKEAVVANSPAAL